jgi:hypothetical protein
MTESGWSEEMEAELCAWESSHWPITSHPDLLTDGGANTRSYLQTVLRHDERSAAWLAHPSSPAQLLLDLTHLDMVRATEADVDRAAAWLASLGAAPDLAARLRALTVEQMLQAAMEELDLGPPPPIPPSGEK